jgi:O-antigen ligase
VEYLIVPPWDGFWMLTCKPIMGSIGHPQPMNLRPWSTLNAPGPCAAFLAVSLAPMMMEKRWRGPFGWLGVGLIASALAITFVRTSYIELILMIIVYISLSTGIGVMVILAALIVITPHLPGGDKVASRFQSMGDLGNDPSVKARTEFSGEAAGRVAGSPLGSGLGTIGESTKLNSGGKFGSDDVVFDNGYLGVSLTYGIIGCILLYGGLLVIALYAWKTQRQLQDPYSRLCLAGIAGLAFAQTSGNAVVLVTGVMFWMVLGAGFATYSAQVQAALQEEKNRKRLNGII